jgi:hypothetical protein
MALGQQPIKDEEISAAEFEKRLLAGTKMKTSLSKSLSTLTN